jgi:hypothetical protein
LAWPGLCGWWLAFAVLLLLKFDVIGDSEVIALAVPLISLGVACAPYCFLSWRARAPLSTRLLALVVNATFLVAIACVLFAPLWPIP